MLMSWKKKYIQENNYIKKFLCYRFYNSHQWTRSGQNVQINFFEDTCGNALEK